MATAKKSLKQRLKERKKELQKKGSRGLIVRQSDEGTIRLRILPIVGEGEFCAEMTTFWLGDKLCYSPDSTGDPCALMETFQELKASDDEDDKDLAKKLIPRSKYLIPVLIFEDDKGKKPTTENSIPSLFQITRGLYEQIIDLYLDEDEWGDMTDPEDGYDIKITRTGTGKTDTNYTLQPCKNTPLPKKFKKPVDFDELVRSQIDSYETTVQLRDKFLGVSSEEGEDVIPKPKKKKKVLKKKKKVVRKKKKRKSDI